MGTQLLQLYAAQLRQDVVVDLTAVGLQRPRLHIHHIIVDPDLQPLANREARGFFIKPLVNGRSDLAELLGHLLLRFAGNGMLDLPARFRVISGGIAGFPVLIFLSVSLNDLFRIEPPPEAPRLLFVPRGIQILLSPHS